MRAHIALHFDSLQLQELVRGKLHGLAVCVIGCGPALFSRLALVLGEFRLLFGNCPLFLSGCFDSLILDGVRRVYPSDVDCRKENRHPGLLDNLNRRC
jgi:hypothetical protein